ncbi:ferritin-like domain-containing protein [Orrella sp. JC864]|uniref:ferritin-like domain-containing protein n=1 Tax=Orrella sp. JC864 TaxID=3120298 RepID=UPI0012BC235F
MENRTKLGMNRTGMQMAPFEGPQQVEHAQDAPAEPMLGRQTLAQERGRYIQEADRLGSVPLPGTVKGVMQATLGKLQGKAPEVLFDKLGQRLAFERTGTRLYEAAAAKADAAEPPVEPQLCADLWRICEQEKEHFLLLKAAMESLGGDPTAQTPCAASSAVASMGLLQVVTDPRTTVNQCLEALLTAELTDEAGWALLAQVARHAGHGDLADSFEKPMAQEEEHMQTIERWLTQRVLAETS